MFAAFAERYQIWAAGAHPLAGAAARKGGSEGGNGRGLRRGEKKGEKEGRKEVESKGKVFKMLQNTIVILSWKRAGKGINAKALHDQSR